MHSALILAALLIAAPHGPEATGPEPALHALPSPRMLEIARRAFYFFIHETDPHTGLTEDRARLNGGGTYTVASIAATGYALTALPIGVENRWISRDEARHRALTTLRFLGEKMPQVHGWYYHFVDARTGARVWKCELSSIDTALLLAGVVAVGQYWPHSEVASRADALLARVDWTWMRTDGGTKTSELTLCHGWMPETGFLKSRWKAYCEHIILYILGLGAARSPLPAAAWAAWSRVIEKNEGYEVIAPQAIFMHQMSQGYLDLRGQRDGLGYDYWQNSINAHRANAAFCARHEADFASYRGGIWGLNASDIPGGYGVRSPQENEHDGTVCPTGAAAGLLFVPELSERAVAAMDQRYRDHIWGRYGFADAFNADRDWWDPDVIGIDLGMALVSIEDARSGLVWRLMARSPIVRRGLKAAGFHRTTEPTPRPVSLPSPSADTARPRSELPPGPLLRRHCYCYCYCYVHDAPPRQKVPFAGNRPRVCRVRAVGTDHWWHRPAPSPEAAAPDAEEIIDHEKPLASITLCDTAARHFADGWRRPLAGTDQQTPDCSGSVAKVAPAGGAGLEQPREQRPGPPEYD